MNKQLLIKAVHHSGYQTIPAPSSRDFKANRGMRCASASQIMREDPIELPYTWTYEKRGMLSRLISKLKGGAKW